MMKSNFKKFLAMFLAVLFIMSTMVTSAFAATDNGSISQIEELEVTLRDTTTFIVNRGGNLSAVSLVEIPFTVPKSHSYRIIVSAGSHYLLASLEGPTPDYFNIITVESYTNLNKNCYLTAGLTYRIVITNPEQTPTSYGVLVYEL